MARLFFHVGRTHKVDLAFVHEAFKSGNMSLEYCPTDYMCADIFTKGFPLKDKWNLVLLNIAHLEPNEFWKGGPKGSVGAKALEVRSRSVSPQKAPREELKLPATPVEGKSPGGARQLQRLPRGR